MQHNACLIPNVNWALDPELFQFYIARFKHDGVWLRLLDRNYVWIILFQIIYLFIIYFVLFIYWVENL